MADIVSDVVSAGPSRPHGREAQRSGVFDAAGQLFDREGELLELSASTVSPAEAKALVPSAAAVLFESCGCGGYGGCRPEWLTPDQVSSLAHAGEPRFGDAYGAPTWIDVWTGPSGPVIFAHGDVEWGDALL